MNYQQTLDYLFSQLPMFQRIGAAAYKADLNNTIAICKLLGNPENKFNAYSSVVGIFLNKWKEGKPLLITGDGSQKRDFIHVYDVAEANYCAALHPEKLNSFFNIGNSSTHSILELAKMISDKFEFIAKREGEADITFADITKAKRILKWEPKHSLKNYIDEIKSKT